MRLLIKLIFIVMVAVNVRAALAMSCYALKELFKLKDDEPVWKVLERRSA